MTYYVIGTMSGSSLDGLDLVHATITLANGKWQYEILHTHYVPYEQELKNTLSKCSQLSGFELIKLDRSFGKFIAEEINQFIKKYDLTYNIHLIGHHGHTVFHEPELGFTYQLGSGAEVAAITGFPTVTHLRDMDVALSGSGAPIIPITDQLLLPGYQAYINLGGICNITYIADHQFHARDITFCNQLLNYFAKKADLDYDDLGNLASQGQVSISGLNALNDLEYLTDQHRQSLSNQEINKWIQVIDNLDYKDALSTIIEHISDQIIIHCMNHFDPRMEQKILITGGGAHNEYLISTLKNKAQKRGLLIDWDLPNRNLIDYKEALGMAFMAVLRWREENNIDSTWSGATRNSIGGALWMGAH